MNLQPPAVIIGIGEIGGTFSRALLRTGHPVYPVLRDTDRQALAAQVLAPVATVVTVGEADLDHTLATLPEQWSGSVVLVQNELLPRNWTAHGLTNPTVAVVWFEKKPGRAEKVIIPTPIYGPGAERLVAALESIGIAAAPVETEDEILYELVRKNMYILTANIGGLVTLGTVHDLWYNHRDIAESVAGEILPIQEWLTGEELDRERLTAGMVEAFDADPEHGSTGRSAPARLARALDHAAAAGIDVPTLQDIASRLEG
jgi:ketopantoate reductase